MLASPVDFSIPYYSFAITLDSKSYYKLREKHLDHANISIHSKVIGV